MVEPVAGARYLRSHITAVVGIDRRLERHPARDFDAGLGEAVEFCRIIGEQDNSRAVENLEHAGRDAIVALIIIKAEGGVCIDGIETIILQPVCVHLVGEAKAAAFLRQIENNATAEIFEPRNRKPELVAAVTAPRSENVAG